MDASEHERIMLLIEGEDLDAALDEIIRQEEREAEREDVGHPTATSPDLLLLKATVLMRQEAWGEALDPLNRVIEREQGNPLALLMLGTALTQIDRFDDARRVFTVVSELADEPWKTEAVNALSALDKVTAADRPRVAIICQEGLDTFVLPLRAPLEQRFDLRVYTVASGRDMAEALEWADVCWFEWCDEALVRASNSATKRCKVVCRIHSYEVFSDYPKAVKWDFVDQIVFVADHVREIFDAVVEGCRCERVVIPNGVDVDRYAFRQHKPGYNLAYVGYLNFKKNPALLLQIIAKLAAADPRYKLHVAGAFQDLRFRIYFDHMVRVLGLTDNVVYSGWSDDVDAWLEDKDYLLSTSVFESFGMTIVEAMAKGIKPVVHHWPGASGIYPEEMLFGTIDEAVEMITSRAYDSSAYRDFVSRHYALDRQVEAIAGVIESLASVGEGAPSLAA